MEMGLKLIRTLHPTVAYKLGLLMKGAWAEGLKPFIFETLRMNERQEELWRSGRDEEGNLVRPNEWRTNARAGESWHNWGLAVDVVFADPEGKPTWNASRSDWLLLGCVGEEAGLAWGGRWKRQDCPHFEYHPGFNRDKSKPLAAQMRAFAEDFHP